MYDVHLVLHFTQLAQRNETSLSECSGCCDRQNYCFKPSAPAYSNLKYTARKWTFPYMSPTSHCIERYVTKLLSKNNSY